LNRPLPADAAARYRPGSVAAPRRQEGLPMTSRTDLRTAIVAVALAASTALGGAAVVKEDDPVTQKADHEALRKALRDKKHWPYFDLSFSVDSVKVNDSRWTVTDPPPVQEPSELRGVQFYAQHVSDFGKPADMDFVVVKHPHYERKGNTQANYYMDFPKLGKRVFVSDVDEIAVCLYDEWTKDRLEFEEAKSSPTKEKATGQVAQFVATAVGKEAPAGGGAPRRVRKVWYVWSTSGGMETPCTWTAEATIEESRLDGGTKEKDAQQRVENVMKATVPVKDKRAAVGRSK
jgi:hypothetical protein